LIYKLALTPKEIMFGTAGGAKEKIAFFSDFFAFFQALLVYTFG